MSEASEAARARMTPDALARHDALRAEVRGIAEAGGRTMKAISIEVGIPYGTFSGWIGGTYAGRVDRLDDDVAKWLASRTAAAAKRAEMPTGPGFVETQAASLFLAAFEHAQHAPDLALVSGAAGVGKTTAANAYRARSSNVWIITGEPCLGTPRMMLDEIGEQLGVTVYGASHKLSRAIVARLRGTRGLLIVDEAQHLRTEVLDQLRTLHDLAEIGVALVGNERVHSRVEGGARSPEFAQLFSRVGMRTVRPKPTKGDIEALLDAWGVEDGEARKLLAVVARKPGALRSMIKTLRMARMHATAAGETLTASTVQMAYEQLSAQMLPLEGGGR